MPVQDLVPLNLFVCTNLIKITRKKNDKLLSKANIPSSDIKLILDFHFGIYHRNK